ncbi:hypothetical protein CBM2606_A140253 [Cupriavidus taiwanensis]|nr:hypothetical protein CBM2606_A140253 [Cupriavidus taiwanensis]
MMTQTAHTAVPTHELGNLVRCAIRTSVINNNQFQIR